MIFKYLAVIFFIVLFLIIAFEILNDLTRERKRIEGKRQTNQLSVGYSHTYGEKVVPLEKRKKHIKKHSRREK